MRGIIHLILGPAVTSILLRGPPGLSGRPTAVKTNFPTSKPNFCLAVNASRGNEVNLPGPKY